MIEVYHNRKFCSWKLDISQFKENVSFTESLTKKFNDYDFKQKLPDSANGFAYSITILKNNSIENEIDGFDEFLKMLDPTLNSHIEELSGFTNKKLIACWANRMHRGSFGTIHSHANADYVLLFYYKVPEQSSDFMFVNPKYRFKPNITPEDTLNIPESEILRIKVAEGLCVLHQGNMLHTVSIHNNDETREVIVLEYKLEGWQSG